MGEKPKERKKGKEIAGLVLLALAVFLLLCLFSHHPSDPSLTHFVAGKTKVKNLGGIVGSYLSGGLYGALGFGAFWIPFFLALLSVKTFLNRPAAFRLLSWLGFFGLLLSTAALIALKHPSIEFMGNRIAPGGVVGAEATRHLVLYLNHIGTTLLLIVVFLASLMAALDVSLVAVLAAVSRFIGRVLGGIGTFLTIRMGRMRRKQKIPKDPREAQTKGEPVIVKEAPKKEAPRKRKEDQLSFDFVREGAYTPPDPSLLDRVPKKDTRIQKESLLMNSRLLEKKLSDFGVEAKVVEVRPGPVITMYELEPASGVKINRITNLSDDLALALKAPSVRIVAPIPGKSVIGIEIPNYERDTVHLREVLDSEAFHREKFRLPIALGVDIVGSPVIADLTRMPHLLIAGTTGSGKSVSLNAMILSLLFKLRPEEMKFLMIDPKRLELSAYEGIPHLIHPVVMDPKKASQVLKWAVEEMERRYELIGVSGVKGIDRYNRVVEKEEQEAARAGAAKKGTPQPPEEPGEALEEAVPLPEKLPYIVIVIDELADLMMVASRDVEESLTRLAQMARAAGIHLILATQRPSVDVITGLIKANFPTRISFQVSSKVDSRTILDQLGAEKLLGSGDMLFMPPGSSKLSRIHGPFVSDGEILSVVEFVKKQAAPVYDESIVNYRPPSKDESREDGEYDEKYDEAVELVTDLGQASISLVQRYLKIGYNRAARIIEKMEQEGVVGPSDGAKPRKVLARKLPD
ncbi:MAG TPA: DNA translocase FtsK 4TM domain-containing protein [Syntrophales bacterium]|nr:DNA translocase FtsK 4TM domain-containing protein [Syntrophales bacterium]